MPLRLAAKSANTSSGVRMGMGRKKKKTSEFWKEKEKEKRGEERV
jgi:hypothetical protein